MAIGVLNRLALSGRVPVFAVPGRASRVKVEDLHLSEKLDFKKSVRHAGILLVVGKIREEDHEDIRRLHDQMPHPRATVWWNSEPDPDFPSPIIVERASDPVKKICGVYREILSDPRRSSAFLLADEPPARWKGVGEFGQGGEGMMGGKPYGRPMPMTADDRRDGLALDTYTTEVGPFLPGFPPGLKLRLSLQGDVIQSISIRRRPLPQEEYPQADPFRKIARLLFILGLGTLAERFLRAAREVETGDCPNVAALGQGLRWSGAVFAIPKGLGLWEGTDARDRFSSWWQAISRDPARPEKPGSIAPLPSDKKRLTDILPGLEWHEAMILLNSFDTSSLDALCRKETEIGTPENREAG